MICFTIKLKSLIGGEMICFTMVKQIISPPIKLFNLAEIFICKQRNNKILTCYGRRNDTFFRKSTINRWYNNVYPVFISCFRCFDWSG